jgi:hypothetical protein
MFFLPNFFVRDLVSYLAGGILLFGLIWFLTAKKVRVKSYVHIGDIEATRRPTFWRLIAQALLVSLFLMCTLFFMFDWLRAIERWLPMRLTLTIGHLPWYVSGGWWKKPVPLTIRARSGLLVIGGFSDSFHATRLEQASSDHC